MAVTVKSRIHRTLRHMRRYHEVTENQLAFLHGTVIHRGDETVYGIYENHPNDLNECIVVTNDGLYIHEKVDVWIRIRYAEIRGIKVNNPEKVKVDGLVVLLNDGSHRKVPVKGREGQFQEVFEFSRFLQRVISDQIRMRENAEN